MSTNRLDNEYQAFLRSQELWKKDPDATGRLEVKCGIPLKDKLDPVKLQGRLDRTADHKWEPGLLDYLATLDKIEPEYVKYLEDQQTPLPVVRARANDIMVRVDGKKCDLPLWEVPISNQTHDLYFNQIVAENNLDPEVLVLEGVRRFQHKADMLRGSNFVFVEDGTRWRYAWDWYDLLITIILGDIPNIIVGTTNPWMGLAHATPVVNYPVPKYHRLKNPSVDQIEKSSGHGQIVVSGANAYQMAHLNSHFEGLIFEWGADLTSDMGPGGTSLPLSFELR